MANEECDDANLLKGDGCSNECTVEDSYECHGGNAMGSDLCELGTPTLDCGSLSLMTTYSDGPFFGITTRFNAAETSKRIDSFTIQYMDVRSASQLLWQDWQINACACPTSSAGSCSPAPEAMQSGGSCSMTRLDSDVTVFLHDLQLGSHYKVRIRGENTLGRSAWCESFETVLIMGLPAPIKAINVAKQSDGSICTSWVIPADVGLGSGASQGNGQGGADVLLSMTLEKSKGSTAGVSAVLYEVPVGMTEMCFPDLVPGSVWTFRLVLCNEVGCSSFDQSPISDPITVPSPATLDYVSARHGDMSASTSITVVLLGLPVVFDGLEVQVRMSPGAAIGRVTSIPTAITVVSGAPPGVQFTISVGPSQTAEQFEIAIQSTATSSISFTEVSFDFEFYDSSIARILSMAPTAGSNSGHDMVQVVLSDFQADSVDHVLMLFNGVPSDLSMDVGPSALTTLYAAVPSATYAGQFLDRTISVRKVGGDLRDARCAFVRRLTFYGTPWQVALMCS